MYLGVSPTVDFLACAGLGGAMGACLFATVSFLAAIPQDTNRAVEMLCRLLVFGLWGGGILAISLVIGETKALRDPNSILGFSVGVLITIPMLVWFIARNVKKA